MEYFGREESISGSLYAFGPLYCAASLIGLGRTDEAINCLKEMSERFTSNGTALARLEEVEEFRSIRNNPEFAEIFNTWK